ncbi:MAG TPA: tryptophan 2,3-dioxygenase family protein, partial [Herpetosiphonaceae bacterium]|nr:tryptophan 2,3-dioxygenase family protein [Herpetosiphonaceae bacterium]
MTHTDLLQAPYAKYLGLEELFDLQGDIDRLNHPEEFQFRTVHLISELWLRLVSTEMERAAVALGAGDWLLAARLLHRCNATLNLLVTQLGLLETMLVADYDSFRAALGDASGLQSPGYLAIRRGALPLAEAFNAAAARPDQPDLSELRELLLSLDMGVQRFL